tara:strand:- start:150 stop:845 length:696 start_codon:yes stop_codon:yes gene_type:complete
MNLLIEYFRSDNYVRHSEYLTCLHDNLDNDLIDKIYVFISDDSELNFESKRIEIVKREERPTYKDMFDFCNENLKDQICIVSNADILFDETLSVLNDFNFDKIFLALTRWEIFYEDGEWCIAPFDNAASQDCWMFKSPVTSDEEMDFTLGKPGCDNKIAKIMSDKDYDVRNPGVQIRTAHYHMSGYRTYDNANRIPGPYICVVPNDNINEPSEHIPIDGFDEEGRPYRVET